MKKIFSKFHKAGKMEKGFALMTVLLLTVLLLLLTVSLISLSSGSLFRVTSGIEKTALSPIAESAVNEVLLKLREEPGWGKTGTEKLYMNSGNQDETLAGLDLSPSDENSEFDFQGKACYYISFDRNDSAFKGTKYYSVNNFSSSASADGWRGPDTIPPYSASILVTLAKGNAVKHVEVLFRRVPVGSTGLGSRGKSHIRTEKFTMDAITDEPEFHANIDETVSMAFYNLDPLIPVNTEIKSGKVTAHNNIDYPGGVLPAHFIPNDGYKEIPDLDLLSVVDTSSASIMPPGRYVSNGSEIKYFRPGASMPDLSLPVVPGVVFKDKEIEIHDNIKVPYDANNTGEEGIEILKILVVFKDKDNFIYVEGDPNQRDPNGNYKTGNITIINPDDKVVDSGSAGGNIYAQGAITIVGKELDVGATSSGLALYSEGDVRLATKQKMKFRGLIYTKGDFFSLIHKDIQPLDFMLTAYTPNPLGFNTGNFEIFELEGSLIAAGKDPNEDPNGHDPGRLAINAKEINIKYDSTVLGAFGGGGGGSVDFEFLSWHEF